MGEGAPAQGAEARIAALEAETARLRDALAEAEAERARLRESERMYRFSAEIARRLVWATDPSGKVLSMSRMFTVLTGIADERALMDGWLQVVHPDDRARVKAHWQRCLTSGDFFEADFRALLPGGAVRLAQSRAIPVRDKAGEIVCWYGSTKDIHEERETERARIEAEEKLRESEELYRHTVELSQQLVWTATPRGKLLTLSPRFYDLTGIAVEVDAEEAWQQVVHPDDAGRVMTEWRVAMERGAPHSSEFRVRLADGKYRLYSVRAAPRRNEEGRIVRWYGTTEDIHEQRQADLARREAEERYRLAVRATNDAIWDYDIATGDVEWSEMASEIVGSATPPGVTPISWWEERIHPDDRFRVLASLQRAIEGETARWSEAYRLQRDDGSYADILDRGFIIRDDGGRAIRAVGALADLTDRRRAEAEIGRMQAELVHVSRVSAMGTMASTLAHELNQPLTAVANYVRGAQRMLDRMPGGNEALREALEATEAGALRAGQIVRRLRELVSRGSVTFAIEDLGRIMEEAGILAFVDEHLHGISHRIDIEPEARFVRADRIQVQQVLINLVRNAVQAMQDGPVRHIEITAALAATGDMVEVRVADTGSGIASEHLESLFSQFMTTKREGMGIGLPISRTIIEAHGGRIWAENRTGGGAVFCFTLPRARRGAHRTPAGYIPPRAHYLRPGEGEEKAHG
ncbi:MAG: PAS domain-containing protein [Allosphingosinicella sp.]|uniref:PAS domain-containing protein n=1 Tax=Allosphingosinicella sp. TaxID=2823234 RepID=UPI00394A1F62